MAMKKDQQWLAVGCVRRSHGLSGFMKIQSFSGEFQHIAKAKKLRLISKGDSLDFSVEATCCKGGGLLIKLQGIDSPEAVRELNGCDIFLPRSELIPCQKGEFYIADLIGCDLFHEEILYGKVCSVVTNASSDLLEIETPQSKKVLVPFLKQFIGAVDLQRNRIELLEDWFFQ